MAGKDIGSGAFCNIEPSPAYQFMSTKNVCVFWVTNMTDSSEALG